MTKAQEVRLERLKKRSEGITGEAEKIFNWILDLMDRDTKNGYYGSLAILLFDDQTIIKKATLDGEKYDVTKTLISYSRQELFEKLLEVVNREDGFEGQLDLNARFYEEKCIMFMVVIK